MKIYLANTNPKENESSYILITKSQLLEENNNRGALYNKGVNFPRHNFNVYVPKSIKIWEAKDNGTPRGNDVPVTITGDFDFLY